MSSQPVDEPMPDAHPEEGGNVGNDNDLDENEPQRKGKLRTLPGHTDTAASFEVAHEDHTLGNALRYMIMKNPDVEFCGYSIPHPAELKMHLRIQTYEGTTVLDALEKGLDDLMDLCDAVTDKFTEATQLHAAKKGKNKSTS